jgi:nucleoside-diphosphate-sugar epimerase
MTSEHQKVALVLGASGGVGGEVAASLLRRGWRVTALARNPDAAKSGWPKGLAGPDWVRGDAMDGASVLAAAQGAAVIVHAVNPPGYRDWATLVPVMLENTIAAARATGARIVLPGTVYNFGPDSFDHPDETARQAPITRKGAIRVKMEQRLKAAAEDGTPCLIVRAGDFFGPRAASNWFSQGLVQPGKPVKAITYPGRRGVGHQWAYLPDVAETIVRLLERGEDLAPFEVFHMEGVWDADGGRMIAAIRKALARSDLPVRAFPWWLTVLVAPFMTTMREVQEMRYLWQVPLRMRNDRLVGFLGEEPHTPLDVAVRDTLAGIGCVA